MIVVSCSPQKKLFKQSDIKDTPIEIAISDFSRSTKLYKRDSVFYVAMVGLLNIENLFVVRVGKNTRKLLLTKDAKVGSKGKLPSRYFEKDRKLFLWWDDDYPLTENALFIFKKYNLLQDDKNGAIKVADSFNDDDAQKAAHYYFCKKNLLKYKKIITNIGIGYYDAPDLNCNNNH